MRKLLFLAVTLSACVAMRYVDPGWSNAKQVLSAVESSRTVTANKADEVESTRGALPAAAQQKPRANLLKSRLATLQKQMATAETQRSKLTQWVDSKDQGTENITEEDTQKMMSDAHALNLQYANLLSSFNGINVEFSSLTAF